MSNTKFIAALAVSTALSMSAASAADLAARPYTKAPMVMDAVYSWTGFYVGVNGGYAFDDRNHGTLIANDPIAAGAVAVGGIPGNLLLRHEGGFGGAQVGYNWQMSNFVLGLEADIQGADIGKSVVQFFPGGGGVVPITTTARDHIDYFGTVRGRLGFAANNWLFYGTGGFAYGGVRTTINNVGTPVTAANAAADVSDTRFGWAAGAGVEWGFAPNWTARAEYLHVDLGSDNVTMRDPVNFPATPNIATYRFHHEFDSVRVGVNYKFGGPVVARY